MKPTFCPDSLCLYLQRLFTSKMLKNAGEWSQFIPLKAVKKQNLYFVCSHYPINLIIYWKLKNTGAARLQSLSVQEISLTNAEK
jgi:hypothetical protein